MKLLSYYDGIKMSSISAKEANHFTRSRQLLLIKHLVDQFKLKLELTQWMLTLQTYCLWTLFLATCMLNKDMHKSEVGENSLSKLVWDPLVYFVVWKIISIMWMSGSSLLFYFQIYFGSKPKIMTLIAFVLCLYSQIMIGLVWILTVLEIEQPLKTVTSVFVIPIGLLILSLIISFTINMMDALGSDAENESKIRIRQVCGLMTRLAFFFMT